MKVSEKHPRAVYGTGSVIAAIYVVITLLFAPFSCREVPSSSVRGADDSSGIYPCGDPQVYLSVVCSAISWADVSSQTLFSAVWRLCSVRFSPGNSGI